MWCAQIGHESGGLRYMEEIADGSAYEGRTDLGNTQPGDGRRFRGRGPLQVTGRHNYTKLSKWAYDKGLAQSPTFFVDQPEQLSSDRYGFVGTQWYWTVARPSLNVYADNGDLEPPRGPSTAA
jgi:predicted chitinase